MRGAAFVIGLLVALVPLAGTGSAAVVGDPDVAALQVALRSEGLYRGQVDGLLGAETAAAVRELQRQALLPIDGVPGPQTRAALGPFGQTPLGSRVLAEGMSGWDVAALQFLLAWHGFPSGALNGVFGPQTTAALLRYQRWARLLADGTAGPASVAALGSPLPLLPLAFSWPLQLPVGDGFGPRSDRFHAGIDIPAAVGTPVAAAAPGRVVYAGWRDGGWGLEVTIAHGSGVRTIYAHLSRVDVALGQQVPTGAPVGLVGATGDANGPHLHFEVRLRGAAVDPLSALPEAAWAPVPR